MQHSTNRLTPITEYAAEALASADERLIGALIALIYQHTVPALGALCLYNTVHPMLEADDMLIYVCIVAPSAVCEHCMCIQFRVLLSVVYWRSRSEHYYLVLHLACSL
jgi:hypothetical protein